MQQKSGEGSFALRKQPPPLSLKAEEPGAGGLLGTDARRPEVPARSRCADPGGPGRGAVTSSAGAVPRDHEIMRCWRSPRSRFVGSAGTAGRPLR